MKKIIIVGFFLILIHLFVLARLQFSAWPEMLSYPYLITHGFSLYQDIALPYQPLLPLFLSPIFSLFGFNIMVLKITTWIIILLIDIIIFTASLKVIGQKLLSLFPLLFFILVQPLIEGNMLWFDLASIPFILMGLSFFIFKKNFGRWFWLGFFLSLSFLIKQQEAAILILLIPYFFIVKEKINWKFLFGGLAIPFLAVLIYILVLGTMKDWFFWTFAVPLFWYPQMPGYGRFPNFSELVKLILIFTPVIGWSIYNIKLLDRKVWLTLLTFIAAFITSFPRFDFLRMQPALALYTLLLIFILTLQKKNKILLACIAVSTLTFLLVSKNLLINPGPTRFYDSRELTLSDNIQKIANISDRIYLLGLNSSQYAIAGRLPPKPWIDSFVWYMEIPGMQDKLISGFEKDHPRVILEKIPQAGKWFDLGVYQPAKVAQYIKQNYIKQATLLGDIEVWIRKN